MQVTVLAAVALSKMSLQQGPCFKVLGAAGVPTYGARHKWVLVFVTGVVRNVFPMLNIVLVARGGHVAYVASAQANMIDQEFCSGEAGLARSAVVSMAGF